MSSRIEAGLFVALASLVACKGGERGSEPEGPATPQRVAADDDAVPDDAADPGDEGGGSDEPEGPPPSPTEWSALPADPSPPRTADGIAILEVTDAGGGGTGPTRTISPAWNTLTFAQHQASDGLTTFVAVREQYQEYSDVVIRGGQLRTNVLHGLSQAEAHTGGCGAAHEGIVMLSTPAQVPGQTHTVVRMHGDGRREEIQEPTMAQGVWIVAPDGSVTEHHLPPEAGHDAKCKGVIEAVDRFSIFAGNLAEYDGKTFTIDRGWYAGRTELSRPFGPRYCFQYCNAREQAGTDAGVVEALSDALGGCPAAYAVLGDRIAARCVRGGKAVRMEVGGTPEVITGLPERGSQADGVYLTLEGHVVFEQALVMERYLVWPAGSDVAGPERTLGEREYLAQTSPTVMVRGLPEAVPPAEVYAVLLGKTLPFGANGSTYDHRSLGAGPTAHQARSDRAEAVLPRGDFVLAHEAAVQLSCGAYVRSPLGWEGEEIHDWVPPDLPPLSSKAVLVPTECVKLKEVHALPSDPDLLLGITTDGALAMAWLPPPLPLPQGYDPRTGKGKDAPPPEQHPRPGSGWVVLDPIDGIAGDRGQPAPGADTAITGGWQAGGGAVIEVGGQTIVLTRRGAWTIPAGTKPMAVQTGPTPRLYGAIGSKVVVCDQICRTFETGQERAIVGIVPRTQREVILGFSADETAVFEVPSTGGVETAAHPLEAKLEAQLAAKPRP